MIPIDDDAPGVSANTTGTTTTGTAARTVIAALDDSAAAPAVLRCAQALASLVDARLQAVHVPVAGANPPQHIASAAGLDLRVIPTAAGSAEQLPQRLAGSLAQAGKTAGVVAIVLGARDAANDPRPLGTVASAVAAESVTPVVAVAPRARPGHEIRRVLFALEGTISTSLAPRSLLDLAGGHPLDIVALHVVGPETPLPFTDQPQHERAVWADEFLARHCPWRAGCPWRGDVVRFETRVGRCGDLIPAAAQELGCDLIVLGWWRNLGPGRARVVRATLARSLAPVMLVPLAGLPPEPLRQSVVTDAAGNTDGAHGDAEPHEMFDARVSIGEAGGPAASLLDERGTTMLTRPWSARHGTNGTSRSHPEQVG